MYIWQCTQEIYNFDSSLIEFLCSSNKCRPSWITFRKKKPPDPPVGLLRALCTLAWKLCALDIEYFASFLCFLMCVMYFTFLDDFLFHPQHATPEKNQPPSEKPGSATDHWKGASCLVTLGPELPSEVWWGAYSCIQLGPYTKKMMLF